MTVRPLQPARRQRADAVRNREAILLAAERLFSTRAPEDVSMDAIADAAGVGKPTVYRSFGSRSGLMRALLETREREFQEAILRGSPPLGPGAPPDERLLAFVQAYVDHVGAHLPLMLAAERAQQGSRFDALYQSYRHHVSVLIAAACPDDPAAEYLADAVLAPLGPELYAYQRRRGLTHDQIRAGATAAAERLLRP